MQRQITLTKTISIRPEYMNHNIIKTVYHLLKAKYEKSCDEEDGIILSIDRILKIENMISKDSTTINFFISFESTVLKPCINDIVTFTPTLIISKGVFGKVHDAIHLFVPTGNMKGWTFIDGEHKKFYNEEEDKTIDNKISVMITDIKFNGTKFNCICKMET